MATIIHIFKKISKYFAVGIAEKPPIQGEREL
jgi:hypothetical protein